MILPFSCCPLVFSLTTASAETVQTSNCNARFVRPSTWRCHICATVQVPARECGETVHWQTDAITPLSVTHPWKKKTCPNFGCSCCWGLSCASKRLVYFSSSHRARTARTFKCTMSAHVTFCKTHILRTFCLFSFSWTSQKPHVLHTLLTVVAVWALCHCGVN